MKILTRTHKQLEEANRWDIDFHLPATALQRFPDYLLHPVSDVADIVRHHRDPTREPESVFQYVDISAVDVISGVITNPQDMEGSEAPSRARKVIQAYDVLISTCRPTRGAIAVVPVKLHNQIASTGFSVVRASEDVNPFYLHFALRLPSTLEQFRKWSTGSSYPAILDSDVAKTLIPVPSPEIQDTIAAGIVAAWHERDRAIRTANSVWSNTLASITTSLCEEPVDFEVQEDRDDSLADAFSIAEIRATLRSLPPIISPVISPDAETGQLALTAMLSEMMGAVHT